MNTTLMRLGRGLMGLLERIRLGLAPLSNRFFGPTAHATTSAAGGTGAMAGNALHGLDTFEFEADTLMSHQRTARAQHIVRAAVVVIVLLIIWAAFAAIDEVTRGDGKVIPSRQLQVVQSLDGGIVSEILVREGQEVDAGQLLLKIDETRATSGVRESAVQMFALKVKLARLKALAENQAVQPPTPAAGDLEQQRILDEERNLYQSRMSELQAMLAVNRQQLTQREQELSEAQARHDSAQRAITISQRELVKTKPLLASGAISEVEIMRMERDISRNRGEIEQASAQVGRLQAAIQEARRKSQEVELTFRNEARKELSDVLARLNALTEGAVALTDKVNKSQVKSPVRGRVQRLLANTVGGVLQPGKDILEIVPLDDALVLEAKVQPKDIAFIHPGQAATVKFTAYDFSIYGGLDATVDNISPDTQVDERGNAFYLVRVHTDRPNFGEQLPIIPGMTAEVDILTGKKTVLSYLLKPVLKARAYALRER
jgi:adhesin transport system membrane fusion protein